METMRVCAEIDLGAIRKNIGLMLDALPTGTGLYIVIKADGYGHGAAAIARELESGGDRSGSVKSSAQANEADNHKADAISKRISGFAVATVTEAMELREAGIEKPILILGYTFPDSYEEVAKNDIRPTIISYEMAQAYDEVGRQLGKKIPVHIKVDTGMGRIGFLPDDEGIADIIKVCGLSYLEIEGLFTHFARADETDKSSTDAQRERFEQVLSALDSEGINIPIIHASNSAAIVSYPLPYNAARAGIITYGLTPSDEVGGDLPLTPALSLYSHIVHIKKVPAGTPISYGGTYTTAEESIIATIPVGYADGYPRSLSNKGEVLISGRRAPIRGRVCMDQMMADVTDIPGAAVGDKVTLIGRDGDEKITAEELGELSGRFNYELVCDLNKRIPRVYINGQATG